MDSNNSFKSFFHSSVTFKEASRIIFSDKVFYIFEAQNHSGDSCQILKSNTLYLTAKPINW